jgi:c-di-GMP-related signal transduction protein
VTALSEVNASDEVKVYGDSKGIYVVTSFSDPVQKVEVYNIQGRKVYESASNSGYYSFEGNHGNSPLIVKVKTNNIVKTIKINNF